jgi:acetaldehyde dehydrogenase/alcohol dehydrogenase
MVRAAYSSGHPSVGVGAGNTPAVIDESASIEMAVSSVLISKTFDNGVICASEQSVVVVDKVYDRVKEEFKLRGAYFLSEEEKAKVRGCGRTQEMAHDTWHLRRGLAGGRGHGSTQQQ